MVSSKAYPGLERAPGKNDNWVESAGGLPPFIERVAKHIHYEGGKTISQAISMAISQCKTWAAKGNQQAVRAIAEWEKLKATSHAKQAVKMSVTRIAGPVIELSIVEDKTGRTPPALKKTVSYGSGPSTKARAKAQSQGHAFKNGRFPIRNVADLNKAKQAIGRVKPGDRQALVAYINRRAKELGQPPVGETKLARRGPYTSHVAHTKQFGKAKGNLGKAASWQHPYQPKNQIAGALKAQHISTKDLDSSGKPDAGKAAAVKKPLPASAAIASVGRKEQHTGAEAAKKGVAKPAKSVKKAPATATLRARRNALAVKVKAGTATPAERSQLNKVIAQLKKATAG